MSRSQPLMALLRPLAAPRAPSCQYRFRFSTVSRLRAEQAQATSKPTDPFTSSPKAPSTHQEASRAADLAATEALTEADSAQPPVQKPSLPSSRPRSTTQLLSQTLESKSKKTTEPLQLHLPPARYHVARSASKNLPIYTDYKRGGNLHLTTVRKITGDLSALRNELRDFLNKKNEDVNINALTGHVVVKGHHVLEIQRFLTARGM